MDMVIGTGLLQCIDKALQAGYGALPGREMPVVRQNCHSALSFVPIDPATDSIFGGGSQNIFEMKQGVQNLKGSKCAIEIPAQDHERVV
jgi:hypothetical protein